MITYDLDEAASRIVVRSLSDSGIPLDGLATGIRSGQFSLMVSQAVVDAFAGAAAVFREVGPVELKGVSGAMNLHAASLPG